MKISVEDLRQKLITAASQVVSPEEAAYFADECIEAHIRKAPRSNSLKSTISDLKACIENKDKEIDYKVDLPSYLSIDFHSQGPLVYLKRIHDELEGRSSKNGIAMASFVNSQSMHTLHTWVQGLAKRGLVALAVCNGGPSAVVPHNGTRGVFGTNPMAFGLPGKDGDIHCVDMATSQIPFFEFMDSLKSDKPLQENAAVDRAGNPTTSAKDAIDPDSDPNDPVSNIVPMGGSYKGYYLVYLLELLTSGLIGMPSSPEMSADFVPEEHGAVLIVFNPKAMGTANNLSQSVEAIHDTLRKQTPKQGTEIRIPGQENSRRFAENVPEIEVEDDIIKNLKGLIK
ncbi:Ldh family oxidoreductase [Candidatus Nomurabacteria bacterium]|nr:Ldh family oxidoreductase [Candidatus Nomurabacteria bacterium]